MNEKEFFPVKTARQSLNKGITELMHEQILFTEGIYALIPISIEMYDTDGIFYVSSMITH